MKHLLNFKGRILVVAISLLALSMITLAVIAYQQLSSLTKQNVNEYSVQRLSSNADKVHSYIANIEKEIAGSAALFSVGLSEQEVIARLKILANVSEASAFIVGFEDGSAYSSSKGKYNASQYDPRGRGWYQQAKNARDIIISDLYVGATSGKVMVTIAKPFYNGQTLAGVLAADVHLSALDPFVKAATFSGAIAALYDDTGLTISSTGEVDVPGESRLSDFEQLAELERVMLATGTGLFEFELLGKSKIAYFQKVQLNQNSQWYMLVAVDTAEVYSVIGDSLVQSVITTLVMIVLSTVAIYFAMSFAYRPVIELKNTVSDLASGHADLTKRIQVYRTDDLGVISSDINTFIGNLQDMMLEVASVSEQVAASVKDLQSINQTSNQVLDSHKSETVQVAAALDEMSATSNDVARNTAEAVDFTSQTNGQVEQSKHAVTEAIQNVTELVDKVEQSSAHVNLMGDEISNITAVLRVIGDIAEQTNLLALNAAIEAARAGEQGRGFAVVADEVRALASRTQESTSEIHNTINRLTTSSQNVIKGIEDTRNSCEEAAQQTNGVVSSLDQIVNSVADINDLNLQIATAAEQQHSVSEEVNRNMVKISDMVDHVVQNGREVNHAAEALAQANNKLTAVVHQFRLN